MGQTKRLPKDERYRERCFPGGEDEVFQTSKAGFVPLPIVMRLLVKHLHNSELRVWMYLQSRTSKFFICYPTYGEIEHELVVGKGTISKAIRGLEKKGFIRSHNDRGVRRYLLRDPRLAAQSLCDQGTITEDELDEVNDLLAVLKQPLLQQPNKQKLVTMARQKRA